MKEALQTAVVVNSLNQVLQYSTVIAVCRPCR